MHASPMGREWDRQFGFLAREHMHHTYLGLLALAKSARDLEQLHHGLPDNCRLLRDDLNALKKFWRTQCGSAHPDVGGRVLSEDSAHNILLMHCQGHSLCSYYADRLLANKERESDAEFECWQECAFVPSWKSREEKSGEHAHGCFWIMLHGLRCSAWCALSHEQLHLLIRVCVPERALTEPIAHKLLSLPETKWSGSRLSREIPYNFIVEARPFLDLIDLFGTTPLSPLAHQAAHFPADVLADELAKRGYNSGVKDGFLEQFVQSLKASGVPVENAGRTLTSVERGWQWQIDDKVHA